MSLYDLVAQSSRRTPGALAVKGPDGEMTYGELDHTAGRIAQALAAQGVGRGDRVGVWLDKSARTVAAMLGILRLGAAYVPVDPQGPPARTAMILADCAARALVTTAERARALAGRVGGLALLSVGADGPGMTWRDMLALPSHPSVPVAVSERELAYILYTSGSTGKPKGVAISHLAALAFIRWAAGELAAGPGDRFANHAPFHFDISVLDLYAAFLAGASVHLLQDGIAYAPRRLVRFLREGEITIWYSVPSALVLMLEQGGLLEAPPGPLRAILFAGEPFPVKHLRRLMEAWPGPRYLNLYGPTETNVCTFHEVHAIAPDRTLPVPIGKACSGDRVWARKEDGTEAGVGEEGELMVAGPTVMLGYWGQPPQGDAPYATGDRVRLLPDGDYLYLGRIDHMVKVRGHRIELGEIESALLAHPAIQEAAVVVGGSGMESRLTAFLVGFNGDRPSLLEIKRHCAERLPRYMIVDSVEYLPMLPRTRNGKVDRLSLGAGVT